MDLKICGIIDIVLILVGIIVIVVGYKKGFIKKLISLAGVLVIVVFSVMLCGQFSEFMIHHDIIYPSIYENINTNIVNNLYEKQLDMLTVSEAMEQGLGIPGWISDMLCNWISKDSGKLPTLEAASIVADNFASFLMTIIAFFIILIGTFLTVLILKLVADALRTNKLIRVVDGILGALFYVAVYAVAVCVAFFLLSLIIEQTWFESAKAWLEVDMMLGDDSKFRISKAIYETNILKLLIELFI